MWDKILEKISYLKEIDKHYDVFGAETHKYIFNKYLSSEEVEKHERQLKVKLPDDLRFFYCNIGNGGVGPYYGLNPIDELIGFRQNEPYTTLNVLKQKAIDLDLKYIEYMKKDYGYEETEYFEVNPGDLTGLISIIHEGCGHNICLITSGLNLGMVVYVSSNGHLQESTKTLIDIYDDWLNKEIRGFRILRNPEQ